VLKYYLEKSWVCTNKRTLHSVVENDEESNQDCWNVRRATPTSKHGAMTKAFKYFSNNGISIPSHVVVSSHAFTDKGNLLNVNYMFNPQIEGISPSGIWSKERLHMHGEKKQYVDQVIAWSEQWHDKIKNTFIHGQQSKALSTLSKGPFENSSSASTSRVKPASTAPSAVGKLTAVNTSYKKPFFVIRVEDHVYESGAPKFTVNPGDVLEVQTTKTCKSGHGLCARVLNPATGEWGYISMSLMKKMHTYIE